MGRVLVGVDLGGTNVRIGIVTPTGRILKKEEYSIRYFSGGIKYSRGISIESKESPSEENWEK